MASRRSDIGEGQGVRLCCKVMSLDDMPAQCCSYSGPYIRPKRKCEEIHSRNYGPLERKVEKAFKEGAIYAGRCQRNS